MPFAAAFLLIAIPIILGAVIWTGWLMWNLVFPEDDRPLDPVEKGPSSPVALEDILSQQRQSPARPVMPWWQRVGAEREAGDDPLAEDLWRRRN